MKKTTGFYLSAISAVLTLACIFLYGKVLFTSSYVRPLLIVSLVLSVVILGVTATKGKFPGGNILPLLNAVLGMADIALSVAPMVNTVVFAFMGMNPMSNAQSFLVFVGVALCAWLFSVIASFLGLVKQAA